MGKNGDVSVRLIEQMTLVMIRMRSTSDISVDEENDYKGINTENKDKVKGEDKEFESEMKISTK